MYSEIKFLICHYRNTLPFSKVHNNALPKPMRFFPPPVHFTRARHFFFPEPGICAHTTPTREFSPKSSRWHLEHVRGVRA
jgi:hypothetical protein